DPDEIEVELTGFVAQGETWKLYLNNVEVASYNTRFRDDLATIARDFAADVQGAHSATYDLQQRGRVLTITHANAATNGAIAARVEITRTAGGGSFSQGSAHIRPQLVFTTTDWNVPQT